MMCTAGRVGSAFAAELGTMAVSEQTDSLRMLGSDPTDYLISPRVLACMIALPVLNVMCFLMGAPLPPIPPCLSLGGCYPVPCCIALCLHACTNLLSVSSALDLSDAGQDVC